MSALFLWQRGRGAAIHAELGGGTRPGLLCPWGQGNVLLACRSGKGITFKYAAAVAPLPGPRPAALAVGAAEVAFPYTVTGEFLLPSVSEKSRFP